MAEVQKEWIEAGQSKEVSSLGKDLLAQSVREPVNSHLIYEALETCRSTGAPLRMRMVLCPNWVVDATGRTVAPIPASVKENQLVVDDPEMKIVGLLSEEVPQLVSTINSYGIPVQLLVVVADILSPGWVSDPKTTKANIEQNRKAVQLLLASSPLGKEIFNDRTRAEVKVASQLQLATNTTGYEQALNQYQVDALNIGTPLNKWYLYVVQKLQEIGEYADKRTDLAGMRKIWERALFLAGIYAIDGRVIQSDFEKAGYSGAVNPACHIGLGTVNTGHGDIINQGWNIFPDFQIGVITPFKNSMEHSWSERKITS